MTARGQLHLSNWCDYHDEVLDGCAQLTGALIPVDEVPTMAIYYHWMRGDSAWVAADTITLEWARGN